MSLVRFTAPGEAVCIYEDSHPLSELGRPEIKRASHVSPMRTVADMGPVEGGRLEEKITRSGAVKAEIDYLEGVLGG